MSDTVSITEVVEVVEVSETVNNIEITDAGAAGAAGAAATISVGTVSTGAPGSSATVTNTGTTSAAVLDFALPRGDVGATGATGATGSTGAAGADGSDGREVELQKSATHVQWRYVGDISWTNLVPLTDITGPTGATGSTGAAGAAATIALGTTTTGNAGTSVIITNSGTSGAAVFNFTIPRGDTGATGSAGSNGSNGTNGREVEIQNSGTEIQWRYVGDVSWTNIVSIAAITGPTGATGAPGADGAGITAGVVELDFGSTPVNEGSVTVTGQTGILSTSVVDATVMARSTADNTSTDHKFAANALRFSVSEPIANTGFTITAYCLIGLVTGKFAVNWRWS